MKELLKKIFIGETTYENLVEGVYAHQYTEDETGGIRKRIRKQYKKRWPQPGIHPNPSTHPWLFDPCEPPEGWIYDPYYEIWIETK